MKVFYAIIFYIFFIGKIILDIIHIKKSITKTEKLFDKHSTFQMTISDEIKTESEKQLLDEKQTILKKKSYMTIEQELDFDFDTKNNEELKAYAKSMNKKNIFLLQQIEILKSQIIMEKESEKINLLQKIEIEKFQNVCKELKKQLRDSKKNFEAEDQTQMFSPIEKKHKEISCHKRFLTIFLIQYHQIMKRITLTQNGQVIKKIINKVWRIGSFMLKKLRLKLKIKFNVFNLN